MISFLRGRIAALENQKITLDIGGLGLEVSSPPSFFRQLKIDQEITIYTSLQFRAEVFQIYGFASRLELNLFNILIKAQGVGPNLALNLLSELSWQQIISAVLAEDKLAFTSVSGIGQKTAARILIDLKKPVQQLVNNQPDLLNNLTKKLEQSSINSVSIAADQKLSASRADIISALENMGFDSKLVYRITHEHYNQQLGLKENITNCLQQLRRLKK